MDAAARLPPGSKLPLPHSSCWARPRRFLGMAIRRNRDGAEGPRAPAVCCQRLLLPYHQEPPTRIRAAGQRTDKRLPCRGGHVGSLAVESIQRSRSPAQTAGVVDPDPQLLLMEAVILSCLENNARSLTEEEIPVDFRSLQWTEDRLETPGERRLEVGCRLFSSPTFARITTALIMVEGGFQAFLVCMEPRECFDLPMFGSEMVSRNGRVTVAFADCSPVDESHTLPQSLTTALGDLQDQHMLCSIPIRKTPPEFQAVFSDKCVVLMPEGSSVGNFLEYVEGALTAYLRLSEEAEALPSEDHRAVKDAQRRYCELGLSNAEKKVAPVLRACTSPERVERFLRWLWLNDLPDQLADLGGQS